MIESRFLCGSKALWVETSTQLLNIREYKQKEFITQTLKNLQQRHERFELTMEPNIKECSGGLRDANTLFWIANITKKISTLRDLTPQILNDEEYKEFRSSIEFLYRVRSALHLSANKKQDTLSLQFVPEVSNRLGFKDVKASSSQFKLSARTFQALWRVNISSKIFTNKLARVFFYDAKNISTLRNSRIAKNIYFHNQTFYASYNIKPKRIDQIIEEILPYLDKKTTFHISFIQYLKKAIIPQRATKKIYQSIKNLFSKNYVYSFVYTMYKADILQKIIPSFSKIMYLPQFDGYHEHPVDIHSLLTLKMIENIEDENVQKLFDALSSDEKTILKLTVFMHDIGKGRLQDHSIVGEKIFKHYIQKLDFKSSLVDICSNIVRNHTLMSTVSRTQDLYNDKTIYSFISKINSKKALDFLFITTYCDLNAVNRSLYTPYVARILNELYTISLNGLDRSEIIGETIKRLNREKLLEKNEEFMKLSSVDKKKIMTVHSNLFFVRHKTDEILKICNLANNIKEYTYEIENKDHLVISIIKKQEMNLGYFLAKLSHLDLVHMDVFKLFNEKKYFKIEYNELVDDIEIENIKEIIKDSFDLTLKLAVKKPIINKSDIKIDCDYSKSYAKMTLNAKDQKGMMAFIVTVFDEFKVDISTAKIQTIKNSTRNLFLIEKNGNFCHNKAEILKSLVKDK